MTISARNRDLVAPGRPREACLVHQQPATERHARARSVVKRWLSAVDNGCMPVPRPRPVVAAVAAVLLAASLACPAAAVPGSSDEAAIDTFERQVARTGWLTELLHDVGSPLDDLLGLDVAVRIDGVDADRDDRAFTASRRLHERGVAERIRSGVRGCR